MNNKANQRILGMTQTELLILISMGGLLLCGLVLFGGYIIYELNRPLPVASLPTSRPALITQPSVRPAMTATLTPRATARPTFTTIPTSTSFVIPTISIPTKTITATTTARPESTGSTDSINIANLSPCEKILYEDYRLLLNYPANWGCNKVENAFVNTGAEGFIEITFREVSRTAKEFCEAQIQDSHGSNRFGKNPTMEILEIDNQPACLVWPSADQPPKYKKASLLVVTYPQKHTLLLLSADKNHIRGFMSSLKFVR